MLKNMQKHSIILSAYFALSKWWNFQRMLWMTIRGVHCTYFAKRVLHQNYSPSHHCNTFHLPFLMVCRVAFQFLNTIPVQYYKKCQTGILLEIYNIYHPHYNISMQHYPGHGEPLLDSYHLDLCLLKQRGHNRYFSLWPINLHSSVTFMECTKDV